MDAKAIYEIVKDWPRAAWPSGLSEDSDFACTLTFFRHGDETIPDHLVELAFEASGMRWLENGKDSPAFAYLWMDSYTVDYGNGKSFDGTTRLEAISAAILALGPGKKA